MVARCRRRHHGHLHRHRCRKLGTATFTVTVRGAPAQLSDLLTAIQGVGPGTSLSDKVTTAQNQLALRIQAVTG